MKNCHGCGRKFVKKVKDSTKECICVKWLCGEEANNTRKYDRRRYLCHNCDHEKHRTDRLRDRAERQLTPEKKHTIPKEK